jgi:uncharacterized membrane protein YgaE (UPF0421/DUF939 family)
MLAAYGSLQETDRMSRWTPVIAWARASGGRLRATAWPIAQCAMAAMLAWYIATALIDHPRPFFAPIAAVVCLGASNSARLRRVGELGIGVTIGVGIADLLVREIGNGWWQIGLVVILSMATAQLFGGGNLVTAQASVQAIFLVALPQTPGGGLSRWEDALIGGTCALLIAAFLPGNPARTVRPQAQLMISELASVVEDAAYALRAGEAELADTALERARRTQVDVNRWTEALSGGEEISRISPLRRRHVGDLARYRQGLIGVDRAARNMRVAIRRIAAVLDRGQQLPPALADILDDLAVALRKLHDEVGSDAPDRKAGAALAELAARLDPVALGARTMSENVVVAQVRSAVVDLLGATGTDVAEARSLLAVPAYALQPSPDEDDDDD